MTNETNQDPQQPTQDSPPPKQYADPSGGTPGRGTDQRTPKVPGRVEDDDDTDQSAAGGKGSNDPSQGGGLSNKDPSKSGGQQTPGGSKTGSNPGSGGGRSS